MNFFSIFCFRLIPKVSIKHTFISLLKMFGIFVFLNFIDVLRLLKLKRKMNDERLTKDKGIRSIFSINQHIFDRLNI